jgi:lysophospholipid acyltransferase (LPLAT)-like uncharacterized protein
LAVLTSTRRAKAAAVAAAAYPLVAALGRTLDWRVEGASHYDELVRSGRPPILALWHGRILPATLYWRGRGIVAMTSENFDGEWVARIMRRFGYGAARGSTSRGGARALAQLRRDMAAGHSAAFTVDGPRGPARVAQPGAVWLAGATGHAILPFHIEASRFWTVNSWDNHQVPKPGSDVAIAIAEPVLVPDTHEETVEQKLGELQRTLEKLEEETRAMVEGSR